MNYYAKGRSGPLSVAVVLLLSFWMVGCTSMVNSTNRQFGTTIGKKMKVDNVYQAELPSHLRRVALLPFHKGNFEHGDFSEIERNFALELIKINRFEVVVVSPEMMKELFMRERYSSIESLPTQLLSKLHAALGIDGVMLGDISYYRPYQPVGLGVRMKLLDGRSGEIVWAVDEVFDSADPVVSNTANAFFKEESIVRYPIDATELTIHSPNRFSKFVAYSIFKTISLQKD